MGFLDFLKIQRRADAKTEAAPDKGKDKPVVIPRTPGVETVTSKELAMRIATVYRCADIVSKGVAQLPLEVKHNTGGSYRSEMDDLFGLNYLLCLRPNDRLSAFELKRSMMLQVLLLGNAYLLPVTGADGYEKIVLLAPNTCTYDKFLNVYQVADNVNRIFGRFPADAIIHVRNLGLDGGYLGMSTISFAGTVLAISANADADHVETFRSGGTVQGFVSGKNDTVGFGTVQTKQLKDVANSIEEQLNSGRKIFNLPGEMSFNQISLSPRDIELLAAKTFNVLEICRFFGVHPDKVFAQQSTNYKASEMSQVSFLTDTLQPVLTQIEQEFEIKLIPREFFGEYKIDFNTDPLLITDLNTKATYMKETIAAGVMTINDWRRKEGLEPVRDGDKVLVSANLLLLDSPKLRGE